MRAFTDPKAAQRDTSARIRQAKVVRTEEACRRVEDWSLRFARNISEVATLPDALNKARNELNAVIAEIKFESSTSLRVDTEARAHQLTMAACKIIEALALVVEPPKQRKPKSNERNSHAGPRRAAGQSVAP